MAVTSLNMYTTSHPLRQTSLRFAPSAAGPKFGTSDSTGSLKCQSEMTRDVVRSKQRSVIVWV